MNSDLNEQDSSYHKKALILIAAAFLLRVLYSLVYPVQLAGDEAYYWDWGRRPALGYFSKPPMIAWIYWVVDWIGNGSLFGIRLASIIFGTGSLYITYLLTRKLYDTRTAFLAVILALAVPGICLLNLVLTIDAPLVFAWSLALYFLWKYVIGENRTLSLIVLFLVLGFGHLSKQMMLFFPVLAIVFLASGKETRPLLKKPGPWLAIVGSLLFLIPPYVIWNSQNGWITFKHMGTHVGAESEASIWATLYERIETFLEFVLTQMGALSPVIAVLIFMVSVLPMFQRERKIEPRERLLIVFCGVPLVMILIAAMFQKIQPNWPAVLYLAGVPLVAAWFAKRSGTRLFKVAISLGFALALFFYLAPVFFSIAGKEGHELNPNRRLIGSARLGETVHEIRKTVPNWEDHFVMASGHRYQAAHLGFYLPDQPLVYRIAGNHIESQYELWPEPFEDGKKGKDAFYISAGTRPTAGANVEKAFEKIEMLEQIDVKFGTGIKSYTVFRCINLQGPLRHLEEH